MYEHQTDPLLPGPAFRRRLIGHWTIALGLLAISLLGGMWGFWFFAGQALIDGWLNAAMLLGGMGPVGEIRSTPGKLFASFFALYAGLAFLGWATLFLAPVFHRILHKLHLQEQRRASGTKTKEQRRTRS